MEVIGSIFYEFNLPNAATWFYFALLLGVALFFKFSRLLSVRNLDVLTLFLLVPGLLLLQEGHGLAPSSQAKTAARAAQLVTAAGQSMGAPTPGLSGVVSVLGAAVAPQASASRLVWFGYLWLFCG